MSVPEKPRRSSPYPRYSLKRAEELARAVFELGARSIDSALVAGALGYRTPSSGSFLRLTASARRFGLVRYDGAPRKFDVTEEWIEAFHHSDEGWRLREARLKALSRPSLYRRLIEKYTGRSFPPVSELSREIGRGGKYGIRESSAAMAAKAFIESFRHAGASDGSGGRTFFKPSGNEREPALKAVRENRSVLTPAPAAGGGNPDRSSGERKTVAGNDRGPDRYEIVLGYGRKAYLIIPTPLPCGEKERLKEFIDLIWSEERSPS